MRVILHIRLTGYVRTLRMCTYVSFAVVNTLS